jgi:hypothetical protein
MKNELRSFVCACALAALVPSALAQAPSALLREGDPLPGAPAGQIVTVINSPTANQAGGYAVGVNSNAGAPPTTSHVFGSPSGGAPTTLRSAQPSVAGYSQSNFEFTLGFSDAGAIVYGPVCTDLTSGATGLDTVWIDDTPLGVEGVAVPTLPGSKYGFNSRPNATATGQAYWVGGLVDITTGASQGRGLFLGSTPTVVMKSGDPSPAPLVSTISSDGIDFDVRFSANGTNWIQVIDTTDPISADAHLVQNGAIVLDAGGNRISEGQIVSIAAGGNGIETWQNLGLVGVNEAGDWYVEGDTNGATATDGFLIKNGVILYREGQVLDGLTLVGTPLSAGSALNEQGDIAMVWDTTGSVGALFLNGALLLREGGMVDWDGDGSLDPNTLVTAFTGINSCAIGPRTTQGVDVYFTADVNVGGTVFEGFFRIHVPAENFVPFCFGDGTQATSCPCANSGAPGHGCNNSIGTGGSVLSATGTIQPDAVVLTSTDGIGTALSIFLQGNTAGPGVPFGDGIRCAAGVLKRLYTKNGSGGIVSAPAPGDPSITTISAILGDTIAPGSTRYYQVYYRDPDALFCPEPAGSSFNVSNGVAIHW